MSAAKARRPNEDLHAGFTSEKYDNALFGKLNYKKEIKYFNKLLISSCFIKKFML